NAQHALLLGRKYPRAGGQTDRLLEGHQIGDVAVEPDYLRLQHAAIALLDLAALTGHALATYRFQQQPGDAHQPAAYPRQLDIFQRAQGIIQTEAFAYGHYSTTLICCSRASMQESSRCWQPISA